MLTNITQVLIAFETFGFGVTMLPDTGILRGGISIWLWEHVCGYFYTHAVCRNFRLQTGC